MKKPDLKSRKPVLNLRREHIRVLTPMELKRVVGGEMTNTSETSGGSHKVDDACR